METFAKDELQSLTSDHRSWEDIVCDDVWHTAKDFTPWEDFAQRELNLLQVIAVAYGETGLSQHQYIIGSDIGKSSKLVENVIFYRSIEVLCKALLMKWYPKNFVEQTDLKSTPSFNHCIQKITEEESVARKILRYAQKKRNNKIHLGFHHYGVQEIKEAISHLHEPMLNEILEDSSPTFDETDLNLTKVGVKAFIERDGKLLALKSGEDDPHWVPPGGRIQYGEDPLETLRREVKEEIGCDLYIGEPVGMYHYFLEDPYTSPQVILTAYEASIGDQAVDIEDTDDPIRDYAWLTPEEYKERTKNDELRELLREYQNCSE